MSATAAALISLVFARSVLHQIGDVDSFIGSVAAYELLPQAAVAAVSRSLIAAEIVLMIAVLVPATRIVGASLAIVMLLGYAAAMAVNIARGRDKIDCGCGGPVQPLSGTLVMRNMVLAAGATPMIFAPSSTLTLDEATLAGASAFTLWLGSMLAEQLFSNSARIRMRR